MLPTRNDIVRRKYAGAGHDGCIRPLPRRRCRLETSYWVSAFPEPGSGYFPSIETAEPLAVGSEGPRSELRGAQRPDRARPRRAGRGGPAGLRSQRHLPAGPGQSCTTERVRLQQSRADRYRTAISRSPLCRVPGCWRSKRRRPTSSASRLRRRGTRWLVDRSVPTGLPGSTCRPARSEAARGSIDVRKGVTLEARLVGPDGGPGRSGHGLVRRTDGQPA